MDGQQISLLRQLDTRDLEVLLAVAECSSFRKAAGRLHLGQSAVSRRIQKLEDNLGVSLFERSSVGARLTHAGSEFVACSSAVFENLKAAIARAQTTAIGQNGHLKIGSMVSFSCGPQRRLVAVFSRRHPKVKLCFFECGRTQMMTMLGHRTLDIAIVSGTPPCEGYDSVLLDRTRVFLAVASDGPYGQRDSVLWDDLADAQFIVSARESGPDIHDYIVRRATQFGRGASITRHQVSREGLMNLVGLGIGVTVVGDHAAQARYPNVALIPMGGDEERVPFSLAWHPENDNPALRRFISLARIEARRERSDLNGSAHFG